MEIDDIIYLACLLSCIGFGKFYRNLHDVKQRKLVGTVFGLLIVYIVSGVHILHTLISFGICAIIITRTSPKICHLLSMGFMFGYLAFFRTTIYFGVPYPPGHTNMIQMLLTLKLVGLAFEVNSAYKKVSSEIFENPKPSTSAGAATKSESSTPSEELSEYDIELEKIDILEIFHYGFSYIGVLTGPYYRYRTFRDYFETPFYQHANSNEATLQKLKAIGLYVVLYLISSYIWPISYAMNAEFYDNCSLFYRLMYVWPTFFVFRMRIYSGLILGESVCTNAGFGAYPDGSDVAPGEGPKLKKYYQMKSNPSEHTYNFTTIQNVNVYAVETCWTFREAMKHWNICVQYWLAVNIYKRFPSKKYRTIATLLVSSYWHGVYTGYYLCIMGAAVYVPIEDMYNTLIRKDSTGLKRNIIDIVFWISKFFAFSYLGIAFLLLTFNKIWFYYCSVYHLGYVYFAVTSVVGVYLLKKRKARSRRQRAEGNTEASQTTGQSSKAD